MDSVIRGVVVYGFLLFVFRVSGKRTLSQSNTFDLVLLLIISETVQEALVDQDHSLTHAVLLVLTLVGMSVLLQVLKQLSPGLDKVLEGMPLVLMKDGFFFKDRMRSVRVEESDMIDAARASQGIEGLGEVKYVVIEKNGELSIIKKE